MNGDSEDERSKLSLALEAAAKKHNISPAELMEYLRDKGCPKDISKKLSDTFCQSNIGSAIQVARVASTVSVSLSSNVSSGVSTPNRIPSVEEDATPSQSQPVLVLSSPLVGSPRSSPARSTGTLSRPKTMQPANSIPERNSQRRSNSGDVISAVIENTPSAEAHSSSFFDSFPEPLDHALLEDDQHQILQKEAQRSTVVDKEVFEQAVEDVLLGKGLRAASRLYGVDRDLLRASLLERGCLLGLRPSTPQEESDTPDERERESYENNSIQNTDVASGHNKGEIVTDSVQKVEEDSKDEEKDISVDSPAEEDSSDDEGMHVRDGSYELDVAEEATLHLLVANPANSFAKKEQEIEIEAVPMSKEDLVMKVAIEDVESQRLNAWAASRRHKVRYTCLRDALLARGLINPKTQLTQFQNSYEGRKAVSFPRKRRLEKPKLKRPPGRPKLIKTQTRTTRSQTIVKKSRVKAKKVKSKKKKLEEDETVIGKEEPTGHVAMQAEGEQEIEKIVGWKSTRQYLVKWQGESEPAWVDEDIFFGLTRKISVEK